MEKQINTQEELRSAVTTLNANAIAMCNSQDIEELSKLFCEAKDLLIAIFKHNMTKLQQNTK